MAMVDFAGFSLELFDRMVAEDGSIDELVRTDLYRHETYYAGLVDADDTSRSTTGASRSWPPTAERWGPTRRPSTATGSPRRWSPGPT